LYLRQYDRSIKFDIWDTVGQERYSFINKLYCKKANVCILVYDITIRSTFEELKNYWIKQVKLNTSPNLGKIFFVYYK